MFILAPHLLFLLGIVGVGFSTGSPLIPLALLTVYWIGLYHTYVKGRNLHRHVETALALVCLVAALGMAEYRGEHYLLSLQYWLAFMLVVRAFRKMQKRDYSFCFLIAAGLFIHTGRTYDDFPFMLLALANLILVPYALFYFLTFYGGFRKGEAIKSPVRHPLTWKQFRFMSGVSVLLIILSIITFLVLPRPDASSLTETASANQGRSAYADEVSLGTFSQIREQKDLVMIVETDRPQLWRGAVLDYYMDGGWRETAMHDQLQHTSMPAKHQDRETVSRVFEIFDLRLTNYHLFSAGDIVEAREVEGRWYIIIKQIYSTIYMIRTHVKGTHTRYKLVSQDNEFIGDGWMNKRRWREPTSEGHRLFEDELFLQLPDGLPNRVRQLAQEITRSANTIGEKADAVAAYLASGFEYSLNDLSSHGKEPIDYFLFQSRKGHCEYFASAMAILLRCAGVRSRVVQGFAPGSLMDGKYFVRLSDAHLWTEVFFPEKGWKAYDPTPGTSQRMRPNYIVELADRLRLKWQMHVLQYDGISQARLLTAIRISSTRLFQSTGNWLSSLPLLPLTGLIVVLALIIALAFGAFRRIHALDMSIFRHRGLKAMKVRQHFGQYLKAIDKRGYKRQPGTTPNELVIALSKDMTPVADDARVLTELFYSARFGGSHLSYQDQDRMRKALSNVKRWAR